MFFFNLLHSGALRIYSYDQCSSLFRRAWMQTGADHPIYMIYIFISAAWSSDRLFSGAVTRQGVGSFFFDMLWCITYNYMIIAAGSKTALEYCTGAATMR